MKGVIMCVDDEKIIIMSLVEQLWEQFGDEYQYEMAMSGEEALELLEELTVEGSVVILIISDWIMNGMRGDELLTRLHGQYPNVRTIVLSGQADPGAIRDAKVKGTLGAYIAKPWDKNILMKTISEIIEG